MINVDPAAGAGDDAGMDTAAHPSSTGAGQGFLHAFATAIGRGSVPSGAVDLVGDARLPSVYAVSDFAAAAVGAAAGEVARLAADLGGEPGAVVVDRDLASLWFGSSVVPVGWQLPAVWDAVAGDYATADGWIRLHTNAPGHRRAALDVLGLDVADASRDDVERRVATWAGAELESAVVQGGGCAATMRTASAWAEHPQGIAVAAEALLLWHDEVGSARSVPALSPAPPTRPLSGVRVLDLTRVLAGPVATRFLAGLGADVLRIDPPGWDEPAIVADVTLGKRCGRLDLRVAADIETFRALLADAHILIHGYRPGALDALGFGAHERATIAPGLVDVALDAYGWTGPWAARRGFDSLVQMSCGIAAAGMATRPGGRPVPLPVQALDHATGYLVAGAAVRGWRERLVTGRGTRATASLARTAALLMAGPSGSFDSSGPALDAAPSVEEVTPWGAARRLVFPARIPGVTMSWDRSASTLGSEPPPLRWSARG